ncbi:gliding motility-associated peptidyl-prolyl isomerase GldI [Tenacibaculum xiamenense]|uniref:gliding motility-associated peptidyl-prolyl isomerase GldI n=1 Tax=Tenacibaculum xiamenense TaxID=1261553 RepID=UPI0038960211
MKVRILFLVTVLFLISCAEPVARKPKKHGTTNFYQEVIKKNKKLNGLEKSRLESWIRKDTLHNYVESASGYWYYYEKKDSTESISPKLEDVVEIEFDVKQINGSVVYDKMKRTYKVDKEDFIPALQDGIKLMKKGETITFVIPSYRAFGVSGDGNKIGINQPIKSTVTLIDIKQINNNEND